MAACASEAGDGPVARGGSRLGVTQAVDRIAAEEVGASQRRNDIARLTDAPRERLGSDASHRFEAAPRVASGRDDHLLRRAYHDLRGLADEVANRTQAPLYAGALQRRQRGGIADDGGAQVVLVHGRDDEALVEVVIAVLEPFA